MKKRLAALALAAMMALSPSLAEAHTGIDGRTNNYREERGKARLRVSDRLHYYARVRARQISEVWGHNLWWQRRMGCDWVGENIAYRRPAPENPGWWFFDAWRDSPVHREVMLGRWRIMASAVYRAPNGGMYGVQLFARGC